MAAMNCRSVRPRLQRYADGEISDRDVQETRAHLLDCPACRSVVASVVSVKRFFADAEVSSMRAPAGFADRVVALAASGVSGDADDEPARRLTRWLSVLAASIALVATGVLLERGGVLESSPDTLEAQEWDASRREITRRLDPSARLVPPAEPEEDAPALPPPPR